MQFANASLHPPPDHKGDGQRHSVRDRRQQIRLLQLRFIWHHAHNIDRLQRVQNSLARVVCCTPYRASATLLRQSLHWLPIEARITFKIGVLTHKVRHHHQPTYLSSMIADYKQTRLLLSTVSDLLVIPRTKTVTASRAFRTPAAKVWNSLPPTVRSSDSITGFRRQLKTKLFDLAYNWPRPVSFSAPLTRCLKLLFLL